MEARGLLETKAHISSEIPFVLQDRGLSDVFKMEWARSRTLTPVDILAYSENLSKLLATKVILQLCDGDIHSARFAELCTRENIDGLSRSIDARLNGLDIKALKDIYYRLERAVNDIAASPVIAAVQRERGVVIPHIEFSEGFFRSYTQEHTPQERQQLQA